MFEGLGLLYIFLGFCFSTSDANSKEDCAGSSSDYLGFIRFCISPYQLFLGVWFLMCRLSLWTNFSLARKLLKGFVCKLNKFYTCWLLDEARHRVILTLGILVASNFKEIGPSLSFPQITQSVLYSFHIICQARTVVSFVSYNL